MVLADRVSSISMLRCEGPVARETPTDILIGAPRLELRWASYAGIVTRS